MDIHLIRRQNLQKLLALHPNQSALADALGTLQGRVSDWLGGRRNLGSQVARRAEEAHQLPHGWMDVNHVEVAVPSRLEELRPDQIQLLQYYDQLSPKYQEMLRETAAGFAKLERVQQQLQQQQPHTSTAVIIHVLSGLILLLALTVQARSPSGWWRWPTGDTLTLRVAGNRASECTPGRDRRARTRSAVRPAQPAKPIRTGVQSVGDAVSTAGFCGALRGKTHLQRHGLVRGGAVLPHLMRVDAVG